MKEDYEIQINEDLIGFAFREILEEHRKKPNRYSTYLVDEKKQAAADVLFSYSKFAMACIGNQTCPSDMRLHLMKEISGSPTSQKRREGSRAENSPDPVGESSSSGTARLDKVDSFRAL